MNKRKICITCQFHTIRKREPLSYCKKLKREVGIGDPYCEDFEYKKKEKAIKKDKKSRDITK